jgi:hypothetical protein
MKKLIVAGCSITHGSETYNSFMHLENVKHSYSQHIADYLGVDLDNIALAGVGNDHIFQSTVTAIKNNKNIHSVIVAWTSCQRLSWINKGRHWFFIPGWASSVDNVFEFNPINEESAGVHFTSDQFELMTDLKTQHKFLVDNYLDDLSELKVRLLNYSTAIQAICQERNIKLVELSSLLPEVGYFFDPNGAWRIEGRHPSKLEHQAIADEIIEKFYTTA